ncbi:MAG: histidine phosphatase family protein, partial [Clostridium sp.]
SKKLIDFFKDKNITKVYCSPYIRSIDTIKYVANVFNKKIEIVNDFRERKIGNEWIDNFKEFSKMQWNDFSYKLNHGESLEEVQSRNIKELHKILNISKNQNIVIGTHGTALSTIINYYNKTFKYESFESIKDIMPLVVCIEFDGCRILNLTYESIRGNSDCLNNSIMKVI